MEEIEVEEGWRRWIAGCVGLPCRARIGYDCVE